MRIGTMIKRYGESVLLAVISYKVIGLWGPTIVVGLYIIGTVINGMTKKQNIVVMP